MQHFSVVHFFLVVPSSVLISKQDLLTEFLATGNASVFTASVSDGQAFWLPPCFLSCTLASSSYVLGVKCHSYTASGLANLKKLMNDPFVQNSDKKA